MKIIALHPGQNARLCTVDWFFSQFASTFWQRTQCFSLDLSVPGGWKKCERLVGIILPYYRVKWTSGCRVMSKTISKERAQKDMLHDSSLGDGFVICWCNCFSKQIHTPRDGLQILGIEELQLSLQRCPWFHVWYKWLPETTTTPLTKKLWCFDLLGMMLGDYREVLGDSCGRLFGRVLGHVRKFVWRCSEEFI